MKTIKIRSDMCGVSVVNPGAKIGYSDGCLIASVVKIPDSITPREVANRFRHTLINTNKRSVFMFNELGINKVVV